jgi:hypothetical protein
MKPKPTNSVHRVVQKYAYIKVFVDSDDKIQQDMQRTYIETPWSVRVNNTTVEKQCVLQPLSVYL